MEELFAIPKCDSPRLAWLKKHDLQTYCSGRAEDFDGEPWSCWAGDLVAAINRDNFSTGATEQDAIVAWAKDNEVRLWNEE